MWTLPKRAERRTRTVQLDGRDWLVAERVDEGPNGEHESSLVFTTDGDTRRVRDFPWLWFGLTDNELAALGSDLARPARRTPLTATTSA
jgi:hypothetical protein